MFDENPKFGKKKLTSGRVTCDCHKVTPVFGCCISTNNQTRTAKQVEVGKVTISGSCMKINA